MKNDLNEHLLSQYVSVVLPLRAILEIVQHPEPSPRDEKAAASQDRPAIGSVYQDGIYAGLSLEDERPIALVLLPGEKEDVTWDKAIEWAKKQGGELPSRIDQLVLLSNLRSEFKEAAYWSCAPYAGDDACAWCQSFSNGYQYDYREYSKLRARAVRRIAI